MSSQNIRARAAMSSAAVEKKQKLAVMRFRMVPPRYIMLAKTPFQSSSNNKQELKSVSTDYSFYFYIKQ